MRYVLAVCMMIAPPAFGQAVGGSVSPDLVTRADMTVVQNQAAVAKAAADAAAAQAASAVQSVNGVGPVSGNVTVAVPVPASTLPPTEAVTPTVGTAGTYRPADSVPVRITRAGSCTVASGICTITWATPLSSAANVILEPVNSGALQPIMCNPTALPTATSVSIKCWIVQTTSLSLSIVTAGISLIPATLAPNGTVVMATAIPATQ